MNRKQKAATWVGVVMAVTMFLYPPWVVELRALDGSALTVDTFIGYKPITQYAASTASNVAITSYRIHAAQLLLQWAVVAMVTFAAIVTLKDT